MERKKLKKYKMAVGICGPTVLYTNIIKAYNPEEAARKYLEESNEEVTEAKIDEISRRMFELRDEKPLEVHYDCQGTALMPGDQVLAIANTQIIRGKITKLTKRQTKLESNGKEYGFTINRKDHREINGEDSPFFAKILKISKDMSLDGEVTVGSHVAYIKVSFSYVDGFKLGTVTRITSNYIYIDIGEGEIIRKTAEKVQKIG